MCKTYREIMDTVEMTDEIRSRILQNICSADLEKKPKIRPFLTRQGVFAAAACLVLLIGVFSSLNSPAKPLPSVSQAGIAFGAVECGSAEELSETLGFEVQELEALPIAVEKRTYCALFEELAQIEYTGGEGTITYRISRGNEDNSGDYTVYEQVVTEEIGSVAVTFKGNGGKIFLALWQDAEMAYSISAEPGLTREQILGMIPN